MSDRSLSPMAVAATLAIITSLSNVGIHAQSIQGQPARGGTRALDLRDAFQRDADAHRTIIGRVGLEVFTDTGFKQVSFNHVFHSKDLFRFRITSTQPGFLYVLHRSPAGTVKPLWPQGSTQDDKGSGLPIEGHHEYFVPPSPNTFEFEKTTGDERFYIAIRRDPKAPKTGQLDRDNRGKPPGQAARAETASQSKAENVEWIIKDPFGEGASRNAALDPGTGSGDLYRYFSSESGTGGGKAMVELQLQHER